MIQRYFEDIKMGTIQDENAQSYSFNRSDWISSREPKAGMKVTFELEKGWPKKIQAEE